MTPKKTQFDNQPYYCFSISQSKIIAKLLEEGKYNDTLVNHLEQLHTVLEQSSHTCDSITEVQESQILRYQYMITNHEEIQRLQISKAQQEKRKYNRHKTFLFTGIGVLTALLFINK